MSDSPLSSKVLKHYECTVCPTLNFTDEHFELPTRKKHELVPAYKFKESDVVGAVKQLREWIVEFSEDFNQCNNCKKCGRYLYVNVNERKLNFLDECELLCQECVLVRVFGKELVEVEK